MRITALILVTFLLGGCVHSPQLSLSHKIVLPKAWNAGSDDPAFPELGTAERYVGAYDRGWWIAVQKYAHDINFDDPSPLVMSGWAEEAYGGAVGYSDARDRIEALIRAFGKEKVSKYLQGFKIPGEQ